MGIGDVPEFGGLFDPSLKGLSAEALYDRIVRQGLTAKQAEEGARTTMAKPRSAPRLKRDPAF